MRHNLYVYEDDDALVTRVVQFFRVGLERDDAVLAVVDARKWDLLREGLGPDAARVSRIDRELFYTRPEAAIARYDATLRGLTVRGVQGLRAFAETPVGRTPEQRSAWTRYEAIMNHALVDRRMWVVCGYDTRERPASVTEDAWRTHPEILCEGSQGNPRYADPADVVRAHTPPHAPLAGLRPIGAGDQLVFRRALRRALSEARVPLPEAEDLVLAASEVLANARAHAGGATSVRVGSVAGRFVCEISDRGPGLDDPLVGHVPPRPEQVDGVGLWIVRQLTTKLDLASTPDGLTARLWA